MVLDILAKDRGVVEIGGALSGNRRALWIAAANHFGDAAGRVVGEDAFELGM
jgi:hypothetical protein